MANLDSNSLHSNSGDLKTLTSDLINASEPSEKIAEDCPVNSSEYSDKVLESDSGLLFSLLPIAASNESHFYDHNDESKVCVPQQSFSNLKTYKKQKFKQSTNTTNNRSEWKMENIENTKVGSEQSQCKIRQDEVGKYCSDLQKNLFKSSLNEALPNEITHVDIKIDFSINDECNFFYDKINEFGHQENISGKHEHPHQKRKGGYKDGIKLDLTLLSQKTPKRACSIKNTLSNNCKPAVGSTAGIIKSQPDIKDSEHIFQKDKSSNIKRNTIDVSYHENKVFSFKTNLEFF